MNILLTSSLISLAVVNVLGQPVTVNPSVVESGKAIGHFPSSPDPIELFHITDSSKNRQHQYGSFTYKWTVSPPKRTFSPLELIASKKQQSRGTNSPSGVTRNELSHHGGVTFAPGAFTYKITLPTLGKRTFAPIETKKDGPTPQSYIYSWAPEKLIQVTKKST